MAKKRLSQTLQDRLKEVVSTFNNEDRATRERQIRTWKQLKLVWEGYARTWYSEVAHDWRIWDNEQIQDNDQAYYDKPVNVFRAYLESIIAALSVTVPPVTCYPDDADNPLDLSTAKAGDKIAALIYKHNDVPLLWVHALFLYMTEGMVACYSYPKEDVKYGTYEEKEYEDFTENHQITSCPLCQHEMDDTVLTTTTNKEKDEFMPGDEDVAAHNIIFNEGKEICPACLELIDPDIKQSPLIVTRLVGINTKPKTRICIEAYGGLNVKVPNYARRQSEMPYLIYSFESHYTTIIEKYSNLAEHFKKGQQTSSGLYDPYERWGRINPQFRGEYPISLITERHCWLRPSAFNVLPIEEAKELRNHFPDGCKVIMCNDEFAEAHNEALDDCWTITNNPLSDFVTFDPIGMLLISIQEITNDLISLILQTIEHGIPQTFASPAVVNFPGYKQMEVTPGSIIPTKATTGGRLSDGFYEVKTTTLSQETLPFAQKIQELGQLVSGALPSLFGGQSSSGSDTASEYAMSRSQALQRLGNQWKIFTFWWKNIFGKVIPLYISELKDDEHYVEKDEQGAYLNVFIRKAELEGKIGNVEIEANENLPLTWNQRKDVVMQILQAANPEILNIIGSPENLPVIRAAIGLTDFYIPGEDDRQKQYEEINQLINSTPIPTGVGPDGQPIEGPSVEVDPDIDNHQIQFEICRIWLISDRGRQIKVDNPEGYKNVLLHAKAHLSLIQQSMMAQPQGQAANVEKPNLSNNRAAPITGDSNVQIPS